MVKNVNILGVNHSVELVEDKFDGHLGNIEYAKAKIQINKDSCPEVQEQTLCHEIIHAICFYLGYDKEGQDEKFVQQMSMAVNSIFEVRGQNEKK